MPTNYIIANLFTTLFNTEDRRKNNCVVVPTSKLGMEVLKTLKNEGYIGDFEHIDDKRGGKFKIKLLATRNCFFSHYFDNMSSIVSRSVDISIKSFT